VGGGREHDEDVQRIEYLGSAAYAPKDDGTEP